jgi:DNA-binding MarR family transcriptional regulator
MSAIPAPIPSLSIDIGQAERTLRGLLDRQLQAAGLSFPEWTTLTAVRGAGSTSVADLVERQLQGRVTSAQAAAQTVSQLRARGLLSPSPDDRVTLTDTGEALYAPLAQTVSGLTQQLWGDLPADDIDAARRILAEVTRRARAQLNG